MDETENLVLDSEVVIANAEQLYKTLRDIDHSKTSIAIDASRIERIDTAAAQMLYVFSRDARDRGVNLSWNPSDAVTKAMHRLGLEFAA